MNLKILGLLLMLVLGSPIFAAAQNSQEPESLGLPGDNLNLYAVLKIFQESETLEIFEKKLNDQSLQINNLDLNGDNQTDYIKVVDNVDNQVHNIVLQVAISATETQDVAVIVVQPDDKNGVQIQVIGDEALYGKDYIVEPNFDEQGNSQQAGTPNPGYQGIVVQNTSTVELAAWPVVRFIFLPSYIIWRSPWYWGYYPPYWSPWPPVFWHEYYGYQYHWNYYYYSHFRRWNYCRYPRWNQFYYSSRRSNSVFVNNYISRGDFRKTYSRPETLRQGSARFRRDNPQAPGVGNRVPHVKIPGVPDTRPVRNPGQRPAILPPGNNRPNPPDNGGRPVPVRPAPRPGVKLPGQNPGNFPGNRPANRPANPRPVPNRPSREQKPPPRPTRDGDRQEKRN